MKRHTPAIDPTIRIERIADELKQYLAALRVLEWLRDNGDLTGDRTDADLESMARQYVGYGQYRDEVMAVIDPKPIDPWERDARTMAEEQRQRYCTRCNSECGPGQSVCNECLNHER